MLCVHIYHHHHHHHHVTPSGRIYPLSPPPPYRPLLPAGLQGKIPYRHRVIVCRFELVVVPLLLQVKGFTGVRIL